VWQSAIARIVVVARKALAQMRNLGPASAHLLVHASISGPEALRSLGAVEAFRLVIFARAGRVSTNLLWAIHGAITNQRWDQLSANTKRRLREALNRDGGGDVARRPRR
jgi:DNA transformation protein and related proteins